MHDEVSHGADRHWPGVGETQIKGLWSAGVSCLQNIETETVEATFAGCGHGGVCHWSLFWARLVVSRGFTSFLAVSRLKTDNSFNLLTV